MIIDTHAKIKEMMDLGIPEKQAEILSARFAFKEEIKHIDNTFATKTDLIEMETRLKHDISEIKYDMLKWMFGFFISTIALNLAAIGFLARFLIK